MQFLNSNKSTFYCTSHLGLSLDVYKGMATYLYYLVWSKHFSIDTQLELIPPLANTI